MAANDAFLSYPFCDADGTFYFDALTANSNREVIAVSAKGQVNTYGLTAVPGLVHVAPHAMDAEGSDIYVLAYAAKRDELFNHDVKPDSSGVWRYMKPFILHFHGAMSMPR